MFTFYSNGYYQGVFCLEAMFFILYRGCRSSDMKSFVCLLRKRYSLDDAKSIMVLDWGSCSVCRHNSILFHLILYIIYMLLEL